MGGPNAYLRCADTASPGPSANSGTMARPSETVGVVLPREHPACWMRSWEYTLQTRGSKHRPRMTSNFSQSAAFIWSLADLLRGDFKQSRYGRVILPFTILRRLECVLEARKAKVLEQVNKLKEEARDKYLLKAPGQSFYNTSPTLPGDLSRERIQSECGTTRGPCRARPIGAHPAISPTTASGRS